MDHKESMLSAVPLFAGLGPREVEDIARLADEVDVPAGKVLATQGAPGHEFFIIVDGSVEISKDGSAVRTLGAGEFFGEMAMLGRIPRTATATAVEPSRLLVVGHREFTALLVDHPAIQQQVLRTVAGWVAESKPDRGS